MAWNDHRECYSNYRVDRMETVKITDQPARPLDRDFDLAKYVTTHISMFTGDEVEVKLRCNSSIVNAVLDRFGMDSRLIPESDGEHFVVYINIVTKSPFYAWLFQFGGKAQVLAPEWVRQEFIEMLDNVKKNA